MSEPEQFESAKGRHNGRPSVSKELGAEKNRVETQVHPMPTVTVGLADRVRQSMCV